MDALKDFPNTEIKLLTEKGTAVCQKMDIFKGILWYAYEGEWMNWHQLSAEKANEIIALNNQKKKAVGLEAYAIEVVATEETVYNNVVGQDSLTRFDKPKSTKKRSKNKNRKKRKPQRDG
jgi:hypothetical protein